MNDPIATAIAAIEAQAERDCLARTIRFRLLLAKARFFGRGYRRP